MTARNTVDWWLMRSNLLSRRAFLGYLASIAGLTVVGCSGPEASETREPSAQAGLSIAEDPRATDTGTPEVSLHTPGAEGEETPPSPAVTEGGASPTSGSQALTVSINPALPGSLMSQATDLRERLTEALGAVPAVSDGDLVIGGDATDDAASVAVDYVAVVSRRLLVREVTFEQLQKLWNGDIDNWADLGSPVSHGVVRVSYRGSSGPLAVENTSGDFPDLDRLAEFFQEERGAIAIIPLDEVDFRFRTLNLDGVNFMRKGEAMNPLGVSLSVTSSRRDGSDLVRQIEEAVSSDRDDPAPVSMTWAGDIIIARQVHRRILETGDWAAPFRSIHPELTWADLTISNLETSLSDSFESIIDPTTFTFKTDTAAIEGLQLAQIDILSRANNHSFNYGVDGMVDTTATLDAAGIKHFGMGHTLHEARQPVVVERNGVTYAFLGYNGISDDWDGAGPDWAGTCPLIDWIVVEDIQRELANGHVVIPFFHWGSEYVYDPNEEQRYFAHLAIDNGAAMVMGSHPHWVQAVETYNGKPIIYSLGNFVFDQEWSLETKQGMMAHVWMQRDKVRKIDLVPILIEDYHKPRVMTNDEAWPVLENIWTASDNLA